MSKRRTPKMAILTSGGDAPGMNAAIRAAAKRAAAAGWDVLGVNQGFRGLIEGKFAPLSASQVHSIASRGGTILGSARCKAFHQVKTRDKARERLRAAGIQALIVIGGNGSLTGALKLSDPEEAGPDAIRVIGVPGSIDNDIALTSMSIGVDTALNTIVDACDRIADTADSHSRTFIIEVMGRDCGYLARRAGLAAGADLVLYPEAGLSEDEVIHAVVNTVRRVRDRRDRSHRVLALKAEGVPVPVDVIKRRVDAVLTDGEEDSELETRVTVLGHLVRGGRPSAFDRLVSARLGHGAAAAVDAGETRKMVAWMPPADLPPGVAAPTDEDPRCWLVDLETVLSETRRRLQETEAEKPRLKPSIEMVLSS